MVKGDQTVNMGANGLNLLTAKEVAAILRVTTLRVYELARARSIPCVRIGRQVRFPEDGLRAWIAQGGTPLPSPDDAPATSRSRHV